jgi:hypothetical protein
MKVLLLLLLSGCVPSAGACLGVDETFVFAEDRPVAPQGTITITVPAGTRMSVCIR